MSIFNEIAHDFEGKNNFVREIPRNSEQQTVGDFIKLYGKMCFSDEKIIFLRNFCKNQYFMIIL